MNKLSSQALPVPMGGKRGRDVYALVSPEDYEEISYYKWHLDSMGYAVRHQKAGGKKTVIRMHRFILERKLGRALAPWPQELTDHVDGDKLNNTRENLRVATPTQNNVNIPIKAPATLRGVSYRSDTETWIVSLRVDGKDRYFGSYDSREDAVKAHDAAALLYHGEFAVTNLPKSEIPTLKEATSKARKAKPQQRIKRKGTLSKYVGVTYSAKRDAWYAVIHQDGARIHCGAYGSERAAARARDAYSVLHFGAEAELNFPDEPLLSLQEAKKLLKPRAHSHKQNGKSSYRGVSWNAARQKWRARFTYKGETLDLGRFDSEVEAAKAWDEAARSRLGSAAALNFP